MTDQPASSDFLQASRVLKLSSPLGEDALLPERLLVEEGVSQLFDLRLAQGSSDRNHINDWARRFSYVPGQRAGADWNFETPGMVAGVKLGAYNGSPTVTAQGKVGVDLTLAQVKGGVGVSVTPYRAGNFVVHSFNGVAEWANWDARLAEIDKSWDWGIFIELGGEAGIGAAAAAEAEAGTLDDGKIGARAKAKAALGPGAGLKLGLGVQTPKK